jgi:competence protein ComEC
VPERFETGPGREFDYPAFLAKDGILYTLSWADVEKLGAGEGAALKEASFFIKQYFLTGITRALPEPAAGLAGGITVGDKRGVGEELGDVFRTVGLTHVIVLSGYNITIVIYACSWLFSRFSMPRVAEFAASVVIALFFALVTGLAAASVRAAAMAVIASIGALSGRIYLASRALALVAAGMVMWNPYVLAFDPGFQLSILATTGLILLSRPIAERMGFLSERFGLREIASATIATQCAVLPLLLYQSGQLSVFALPVNLLVLAVVPTAMLFSTVAALGGLVFGALAPLIAFPALVLLSYMIAVADFFARLPFASVTIPAFGAWMLLLLYVALGGAYLVIAGQRTAAPRPSN